MAVAQFVEQADHWSNGWWFEYRLRLGTCEGNDGEFVKSFLHHMYFFTCTTIYFAIYYIYMKMVKGFLQHYTGFS